MRLISPGLALVVCTAALVACSDDDIARSDVTIYRLNGGDPLQSDVLNNGSDELPGTGDEFIPEDEIRVVFRNMPSDAQGTIGPDGGAFSNVTFNRFKVSFITDPAYTIDSYEGGMHANVASGDTSGVAVVIVPGELKARSPLAELQTEAREILATAHLEFWGEEHTSRDEIYLEGDMVVNFANFGDAD